MSNKPYDVPPEEAARVRKMYCPGGKWTDNASSVAATRGDFVMLREIHKVSTICDPYAVSAAAMVGQFEIYKWLINDLKFPITSEHAIKAAAEGHYDIVDWIHQKNSEFITKSTVNAAASGNSIQCLETTLKFVPEFNTVTDWDYEVMMKGPCVKYPDVIRFCYDLGARFPDEVLYSNCCRKDAFETFKFLLEEQKHTMEDPGKIAIEVLKNKNMKLVHYLIDSGFDISKAMMYVITSKDLDLYKKMEARGYKPDRMTLIWVCCERMVETNPVIAYIRSTHSEDHFFD